MRPWNQPMTFPSAISAAAVSAMSAQRRTAVRCGAGPSRWQRRRIEAMLDMVHDEPGRLPPVSRPARSHRTASIVGQRLVNRRFAIPD